MADNLPPGTCIRSGTIVLCCGILLFAAQAQDQNSNATREHFQNADVVYGSVVNNRGQRLRTFTTHPHGSTGRLPAIFFVGWLSCDSVAYPKGPTDGFGALIVSLIEQSGYATVRTDKPGVGESEGSCSQADFNSELSGYQNAFAAMRNDARIDPDRLFMVGLSNGGGVSPLVAGDHPVLGFVAAGSWGRTWYEHMLDAERRRLVASKASPAVVNDSMRAFSEFYDLYLNQGGSPGEILKSHLQWNGLWYDAPDGQFGRPAAFYQQLQRLNLGQAWQSVTAPVLVIHGSQDSVMSRADSEGIAQIVNQAHPGRAQFIEIEGMTHGFEEAGKFKGEVTEIILDWMKQQLSAPPNAADAQTPAAKQAISPNRTPAAGLFLPR